MTILTPPPSIFLDPTKSNESVSIEKVLNVLNVLSGGGLDVMDVSGSRRCVAVVPGLTLVSPGGNRVTIFIWQKKSVKHCSTHGEIVLLTNIQYIIHI